MSTEQFDRRRPFTGRTPVHRFRCVKCSFGASRSAAPERCPMCGGSAWEYEAWRPFSELAADVAPKQGTTERLQ
jgi:rubrerythrin